MRVNDRGDCCNVFFNSSDDGSGNSVARGLTGGSKWPRGSRRQRLSRLRLSRLWLSLRLMLRLRFSGGEWPLEPCWWRLSRRRLMFRWLWLRNFLGGCQERVMKNRGSPAMWATPSGKTYQLGVVLFSPRSHERGRSGESFFRSPENETGPEKERPLLSMGNCQNESMLI